MKYKINKIIIFWENEFYDDLCRIMDELISKNDFYLFTVVCGGQSAQQHQSKSAGERWALDYGVPIEYLFDENPEILMRKIVNGCDYLVMLLTNRTPQQQKQIMMRMKGLGKHGTVIRK